MQVEKRSEHNTTSGHSSMMPSLLRKIGRAVLPLISLAVTMQPLVAYAAPTPSLLMQEPRFVDVSVASNVIFMMDDSASMADIRLPVPAGLNPDESAGGVVTTRGGIMVERVNEWIYRSSTLNPIYYNPAITYKPWNDNGRGGATGRFTNASTLKNDQSNGFREGLVRQDMRYAGPNYTSASFNGGNRLNKTGANPESVPAYLQPSRPANGGFQGGVDSGRNQDIFSSPFVFVTTLTPTCSATVTPTSSPQTTLARTDSPQPFTPRGAAVAPSSTSVQPSSPRNDQSQPSTVRTSQTPTSTPRPAAYRVETGLCGSFGPWTAGSPPATVSFCSDGETTRVAIVQTGLLPCPSGTTTSGSNCLSCSSGFSVSGSVCLSNCPAGTVASNSTTCFAACPSGYSQVSLGTCRSNCPSGTVSSNATTCYAACLSGTPTSPPGTCVTCGSGTTASGTQCLPDCPPGTVAQNATQCFSACLSGTTQVGSGGICRTDCPPTNLGDPLVRTTSTICGYCPSGATASGSNCIVCPPTSIPNFPTLGQCCTSSSASVGGCPYSNLALCPTVNRWYASFEALPALARYYVFVPPTGSAPTSAELSNPANYEQREINRDAPRFRATFDKPYPNNDPTQDRSTIRLDCGTGTTCTWAQEAQNFANWYTYYRTRLFSAVAVTAESLSQLTAASGIDSLRLGYGSINYFPNGANPFPNINPIFNARLPSLMAIDGQSSVGAIVRGVRPFTEVTPPPSPGSNNRRQEVFDWLFALREIGATPNREAIDAIGRYFARSDNRSPWIQPSDPSSLANWVSTEDPSDHLPCRRNYTIMITDGEWTNSPIISPPSQPIISDAARAPLPSALAAQGGSPTNALTTIGPVHTPQGAAALVASPYGYNPTVEQQFSGGAGSTTGTLSDVTTYYWSRDLRTDLSNNIKPSATDKAFWQHLTPYIVGYGIDASRDNTATRAAITAATPITWPAVRLESRPSEDPRTIVSDRDVPQSPPAAATPGTLLTCGYDPVSNPSGCGRVDDTFRAAMAGRGDFLTATSVTELATSVANAFARIAEKEATATAVGGRSSSLRSGDRLYFASFVTNRWIGKIDAFDAVTWFDAVRAGTAEPAPAATSNFPAPASRNVLTSTGPVSAGTPFEFANLSAGQQAQLGNATLVSYLRGDQTGEIRNGGVFRNRDPGAIMGDIVNSSPLYSKAPDEGYNAARRPSADTNTGLGAANAYRDHVNLNQAHRPAAIYVGANSGMLHVFDATTLQERFAYVPRAVYPTLPLLGNLGYLHRYYVDGPIVQGDVYIGGAWRTVIVSTTGAGPKGIFALDVTQRSGTTATNVTSSNVLWDLTATDAVANIADLGNITQPGVIGSARDGQWYYFTGNGSESQNDKAVLLAIRISDGAILSIPTDSFGGPDPLSATESNRPNGLGGVTPVYDSKRNIVGIYAGDRQGRVWKFDLSSTSPSAWTSSTARTLLFEAKDAGGKRQPISAAPRVMAHPLGGRLIAVGTGRLTENDDPGDTSMQSIYGLWERNTTAPTAITKIQLRKFTLTETGTQAAKNRVRTLNGTTALNWNTDRGWYVDLYPTGASYPQAGERVIVSPSEDLGFINVTSFEPIAGADRCQGGGQSFFYRFDVAGDFQRVGFQGRPASVVGIEMPGAMAGYGKLGKPSDTTATGLGSASQAQMGDIAQRALGAPGGPAAATNACGGGNGVVGGAKSIANVPSATMAWSCVVPAQRVWREMPRGRR